MIIIYSKTIFLTVVFASIKYDILRLSPKSYIQLLDHLNDFLKDVQQKLLYSKEVIERIDFEALDKIPTVKPPDLKSWSRYKLVEQYFRIHHQDFGSELERIDDLLCTLHSQIRETHEVIHDMNIEGVYNFSTVPAPLALVSNITEADNSSQMSYINFGSDITNNEKPYYLCNAYVLFLQYVSTKPSNHLRLLFRNTKTIINRLIGKTLFKWLGPVKIFVADSLGDFFGTSKPEDIKSMAKVLSERMINRKTEYNDDINDAIDFAHEFVTERDADRMFENIRRFKAFPRLNKTGDAVTSGLVIAFNAPFERMDRSNQIFLNFMEGVISILKAEYPDRLYFIDNPPGEILRKRGYS